MSVTRRSSCRARGIALPEALLSILLTTIALLAALTLYDAERRALRIADGMTEQQQALRAAFDRMTREIRMAGFNCNPDGDPRRPDEAIEAAYDTAIVVRSDSDADDSALASDPETSLAGGGFGCVSTGNDEIVVYALAKPDGTSEGDLSFDADVAEVPRDGRVENVIVRRVALVQDDPPYTLYRMTLDPNPASWGEAAFIHRAPVIDNVYSMTFRYLDRDGVPLNSTFDLSSPTDDIGGADAPARLRARDRIRRVAIELAGLSADPDPGWTDPLDPHPSTRSHRKFRLSGEVSPRNLGSRGAADLARACSRPRPFATGPPS